jgi:hypothetical protein
MVYHFDFFAIERGERMPLDTISQKAASVDMARNRAKAIMRNIKIRDRRAELCEVRDQTGHILIVVQ